MNNNNFQNQGFNNNGFYPNNNGYQYAQRPQMKMTQALTQEEMNSLKNRGAMFSLKLEPEEILRGICTHKNNQGFTIRENMDGSSTCSICGETFMLVSKEEAEVQNIVDAVTDVLQTVKTYHVDIGQEAAREYFTIIPLLKRLPRLYKISLDTFNKYDGGMNVQPGYNQNGFGMLNNIMGNQYQGNFQQQNFQNQGQFQQQNFQNQGYPNQNFQNQGNFNNQGYQNQGQYYDQNGGQGNFQQQQNPFAQQQPVQQQAQQPVQQQQVQQQQAPQQTVGSTAVNTKVFNI